MNPFKAIAIRLRDQGLAGFLPTKNNVSLRDLHPDRIAEEAEAQYHHRIAAQPLGPPPGYEDPSLSRRATATPGVSMPQEIREQYESLIGQPLNDQTRAQVQSITEHMNRQMHPSQAITANLNDYSRSNMSPVTTNASITREHPPLYSNNVTASSIQGDPMAITRFAGGTVPTPIARPCKDCANEITDNIYCGVCDRGPTHYDRPLGALPIIDRFISKDNRDYLYNEWKEKVTEKLKKQARQEILDEMKEEKKIYKKAKLGAIVRAAYPDIRHKC